MNLKYIVTAAVIYAGSHRAFAAEPELVTAEQCTKAANEEYKCIDDLTVWIAAYDGVTRIERTPDPDIVNVYRDGVKDGIVTESEYRDPRMAASFPCGPKNEKCSREEIKSAAGYSITQAEYAITKLWLMEQTFEPFDVTGDKAISPADDINKDNKITREDRLLYLAQQPANP